MFNKEKYAEFKKRGYCIRSGYAGAYKPRTRYNDKLLDVLFPIDEELVNELKKIYNLFWVGDGLCCSKYENRPVILRSSSPLNGVPIYSISKVFLTKEYSRTNSPMLRKFMDNFIEFYDDLEKCDKEKREKLNRLTKRDISLFTRGFMKEIEGDDEEILLNL